jgi:hypothetical protein
VSVMGLTTFWLMLAIIQHARRENRPLSPSRIGPHVEYGDGALCTEPVLQRVEIDLSAHDECRLAVAAVSFIRTAATTPEANVSAATSQMAACTPRASAVRPASSAPTA